MLERLHSLPLLLSFIAALILTACQVEQKPAAPLPEQYRKGGAYTKILPYFNPDSCVMLIRRDVPPQWQGAAYENLFLGGPEDSPFELGLKHLNYYEKNFPADTATEFVQLWRGRIYTRLGKLDSARACLQASYESSLKHKRYLRAGDAKMALGNTLYTEGKSAEAIRAFISVFETFQQLDSTQNERKTFAAMAVGAAYSQTQNHREALRWTKTALQFIENPRLPTEFAAKVSVYKDLSVIYRRLHLLDSALLMAQTSIDLSEKHKTTNSKPVLLYSIAQIYLERGDCTAAVRHLLHIKQISASTPQFEQRSPINSDLGKAYFCLGKLDSAEYFLKKPPPETPAPTAAEWHNRLSMVYAAKGAFKEAYQYLRQSVEVRAKNFDAEKVQEIGGIRGELELERAERRTDELHKQHQIKQYKYIIAGLTLLSLLIALVALFLRQRSLSRNLSQEKQILEKDKILLAQEKQLAEALTKIKEQELESSETSLKDTRAKLDQSNQLLQFKDQLIEELQLRLNKRHHSPDDASIPGSAEEDMTLRSMKILTNADWAKFRDRFDRAFPGFQSDLISRFPDLTPAEIRLFLLLKLKFTNKEASETLGISQESIYRSRNRLSKKLGVADTALLDDFIQQFS